MSRYEGRPFALLGVNADPSAGTARKLEAEGAVTWPSWWDDGGRISGQWGVELFPTLFVIDHKGVVRYTYVGAPDVPALERNLEGLVREAESAGPAP